MELVRQDAVSELHSITQSLTESHRNEATTAIAYVSNLTENALNRLNLTENALNRLNKQSHELQQMAENDERLDARTRQMITARKNQLRNQAKEQESPERAKPKARSEPFKFNTIPKLDNAESTAVKDDENPETTHEPKGKSGRPSNIRRSSEKNKNPTHDTEKDENRTRTHWRKTTRGYLVRQLAKHGWKLPKTSGCKNVRSLKKESAQPLVELLGIEIVS